jgi:hypothetical protein
VVTPAEDRCDRGEIDARRQPCGKSRGSDDIFGKAAVHAVTGIVLMLAQRFPAGRTIFAGEAGVVQPGDANGIADLAIGHAWTERRDDAGGFVTR